MQQYSAKEGIYVKEAFDMLLEQMIIAHYQQYENVGSQLDGDSDTNTDKGHCCKQLIVCLLLAILLPTICTLLVLTSIKVFDIY